MPQFISISVDKKLNKKVKKIITAKNKQDAINFLRKNQFIPISVKENNKKNIFFI